VTFRERQKVREGLRLKPYRCPKGKLTLGYGRNLDDVGITVAEAELLLDNDIARVTEEANAFPVFKQLDLVRQEVFLELLFNMGSARVKGFKRMLRALELSYFEVAAAELLDSDYARQVGARARELAGALFTGRWD
jgi:lysozyme